MKTNLNSWNKLINFVASATVVSIIQTPFYSVAQPISVTQNQAQRFVCAPSKLSDDTPSQIRLQFLPSGQIQEAQVFFQKPFKNSIRTSTFNAQNSKMSTAKGGDDPINNPDLETILSLSQDWGDGITASVSFKVTDFRGRRYSPYESLVGEWTYTNINGPYEDGKLWFSIYNAKFPARWGSAYHCQPVP